MRLSARLMTLPRALPRSLGILRPSNATGTLVIHSQNLAAMVAMANSKSAFSQRVDATMVELP